MSNESVLPMVAMLSGALKVPSVLVRYSVEFVLL